MGEGESKELKGHLPPHAPLSISSSCSSSPNNEAGAWLGCQRSVQWPVAPEQHCRATCPSIAHCHSSQNTECLWCWRTTAVSSSVVQLPTRWHAAFMLEFHSAGIQENPLRSVICHSWLHQWKYTRTHQYRGEPSKKCVWARCVSPLVYDTLRKPPFPPLQQRRQTTAARYNATDRSEKATADCLPSHSLSYSLPLNPAFSAVVSIGDQYGTWSTRAWDHDIHPLHLEATQLAPWLWSQWAPSSKGARSSMPTTVTQTAIQWSSGCQVLLTVCLAQPTGFWSAESFS